MQSSKNEERWFLSAIISMASEKCHLPTEQKNQLKLELSQLIEQMESNNINSNPIRRQIPDGPIVPIGTEFYILNHFEKRMSQLEQIITHSQMMDIFKATLIVAIKIEHDCTSIYLTDFPFDTNEDKKQLEREHLQALNYKTHLPDQKDILSLIEKYCNKNDIAALIKKLEEEGYQETEDYIAALKKLYSKVSLSQTNVSTPSSQGLWGAVVSSKEPDSETSISASKKK